MGPASRHIGAKPRLAVSVGEPAGIGPDIVIDIAERDTGCDLTALVDPQLLDQRARIVGSSLSSQTRQDGQLYFGNIRIDATRQLSALVNPGQLDVRNARYVHECISAAATSCLTGRYDAMVTAPVHKAIINDAGIPFSGHTELIAALCAVEKPVMMLANADLRVALVTTHLPLRKVPDAISCEAISAVVGIVYQALQTRFAIASPRLLVCGLNPHAGEKGHLGREEIDTIIPCLETLREHNLDTIGPVPADTAFAPHMLAQADAVIAMYHDQGLPVIKAQGFGATVNITLGLPIIRTSVDHGTALELAGSGRADSSSLLAAIEQAKKMVEAS